jgi:hypothetical protein
MATTPPLPPPTHRVLFDVMTAAGTKMSNNLVLELYGREMPATVDFITKNLVGKNIDVDRIIPGSKTMPLCKLRVPLGLALPLEAEQRKITPSYGSVSMAEVMSTGSHNGSFKVHLDDSIQQPVFGRFVQNSSFDNIFTQTGSTTKDNRFILTVREIIPL